MRFTPNAALMLAAALLMAVVLTSATSPDRWIQGSKEDYLKGQADGTSIADDGSIRLSPSVEQVYTSSTPSLWSLVRNPAGEVFAAGGSDGVILDQRGNIYHSGDTSEIYAIAWGPDSRLYFASSPGGSIYRLTGTSNMEEFFTPRPTPLNSEAQAPPERYIWDIVFDSRGDLYAATGLEGRIYRVNPQGNGAIAFDSDEAHITCLAMGPDDTLYFGSDPGGQVFRMDSEGDVFVLFDSDYKEISDISVAADGSIYFAAVAEAALEIEEDNGEDDSSPLLSRTSSTTNASVENGDNGEAISALFHIDAEGTVERVWSSGSEIIHALGKSNEENGTIAGTGPGGSIYHVDSSGRSLLLHSFRDRQVTALLNAGSKIYAATSNMGELYTLSTTYSPSGTFTSQVKDAGAISSFGVIKYTGTGDISLKTRTGNTQTPDNTWSKWSAPSSGNGSLVVTSPSARYLQWRAELSTIDPATSPSLTSVSIYFIQNNLRPIVKSLTVLPAGVTFKPGIDDPEGREIPAEIISELEDLGISAAPMSGRGKAIYRTPVRSITWKADDANGDQLRYNVLIRALGEQTWSPIARNVEENYFSFDTRRFDSGDYLIRVVAEDSLSNAAGRAKSGHLDSRPFVIDNEPPKIENLIASAEGNPIRFGFSAADGVSSIRAARYKVNDGEWRYLLPEDGISDEQQERFDAAIEEMSSGTYLLSVQVIDEVYNTGAASSIIRVN